MANKAVCSRCEVGRLLVRMPKGHYLCRGCLWAWVPYVLSELRDIKWDAVAGEKMRRWWCAFKEFTGNRCNKRKTQVVGNIKPRPSRARGDEYFRQRVLELFDDGLQPSAIVLKLGGGRNMRFVLDTLVSQRGYRDECALLRRLYWDCGLSLREVGVLLGQDRRSIGRLMCRLAIPLREPSKSDFPYNHALAYKVMSEFNLEPCGELLPRGKGACS